MTISVVVWFGLEGRLSAQPTLQWQRALGGSNFDEAQFIITTTDGGYAVIGDTYSNDGDVTGPHGGYDVWVLKLSPSGSIVWQKTLGGSAQDYAKNIVQTTDGGFIIAGATNSNDGDVSGLHSDKDAWIVKLSATGEIQWQKALGGPEWDEAWSIVQTPDNGFVFAGRSGTIGGDVTNNHGFADFWVVKLSSNGVILWEKSFGGSSDDEARAIKHTKDGGFIVVGKTKSIDGNVSGNHGNVDFWVLKLTEDGELAWQKAFGGCCLDVAEDVIELEDGYLISGYVSSNDGDVSNHHGLFDYWLVKTSKNGEMVWQKTFGGSNSDYARSIFQTEDGMIVVAGETKSSDGDVPNHNGIQVVWLMQLKSGGELVWQKILGGSDGEGCRSIQPTPDNGLIFAGYAWSHDGDVSGVHGQSDFWVVKLAPESVGFRDLPENPPGQLQVSPNPADEIIQINAAETETQLQLEVFDVFGRKMQAHTLLSGDNLNISNLPAGLYFVHAVGDSGQRYMGRILKQ